MKKMIVILCAVVVFICAVLLAACSKGGNNSGSFYAEGEAFEDKTAMADPIDDNYRVFYQIFVGSFSDSNGDGIGDLRGIINKMDYLNDGNINSGNSLGIQGIWLSPIFKSPSYHKYDATDYYKIDEKFGTEQDLKDLISICHERNVKLILDIAINHTATDNEWFINFKTARQNGDTENKYYDYYTCREEYAKGWYQLSGTSLYYEGNFSSSMPELNYDNDDVREEVLKIGKHYLDMGIDGFRFDAIKYIYYESHDKSAVFWQWYMSELKKIKPDIYAVGECWDVDSVTDKYYSALNCFNFTTAQAEGTICRAGRNGYVSKFTGYVEDYQKQITDINPDAMYCPFIANHDTDRAAGYLQVSENKMQMAANIYILCCGSPFIYYGEEIGMKGSRGGANTDANRRLAMLWGDGNSVKDPEGSTYDGEQVNGTVASQLKNSGSILRYYQKLIRFRSQYPEIARGTYKKVDFDVSETGGFEITYQGKKTYLIHNASVEEVEIDISGYEMGKISGFIGQSKATLNGTTLKIGKQTSVVLK